MDFTAEQVWELVKDWPEEARPIGVRYADNLVRDDGCLGYWHFVGPGSLRIPDAHAAALHVASGIEWLAGDAQQFPQLHRQGDEWGVYAGPIAKLRTGPTLLHAVSAAVMAVTD